MHEDQDKWEKLINITDDYQPDPDLANKAILKLNQRENAKDRKPFFKRMALLACGIVLGIAIFLPVYFSNTAPQIIYYSDDSLEYSTIEDIDLFVAENELNVHYFNIETVNSQCVKIKDNGNLAYLKQRMFYVNGYSFDEINLKVILISNTEYSFCEDYEILPQQEMIMNIPVSFSVNKDNQSVEYKTKFVYEDRQYFLDITTPNEDLNKLSQYIDLLING